MRKFWDTPGVFALTIVVGPVVVLCLLASIFNWWG